MFDIICCKDCENRCIGCHSNCKLYIEEKKQHDLMREDISRMNEYIRYARSRASINRKIKIMRGGL